MLVHSYITPARATPRLHTRCSRSYVPILSSGCGLISELLVLEPFRLFLVLDEISTGLSVSSGNGTAIAPEIASIGEAWRTAISSKISSRLVVFLPRS
ncbi:hypothetical protein C4D60_Mb07t06190 [Musa balbisiana]|uniref:Uncharacterized protein n=1 Tax=Musa balbisiana TaxID=52838 RepID=A0A4S8JFV7_MUSBA|nr:hypothetical protein C4D60_Mb07t06190 [Musa balbisiana]